MKKYKLNISDEPHNQNLESIGSIFIPMLKSAMASEDLVGIDIILNWNDIVGKEIAKFCNPLKTKFNPKDNNRVLFVEVPAGGFALEIQHKENYILEKINAYFGYKTIHKLNISQNINMQIKKDDAKVPQKDVELSDEDKNYLLDISKDIKDEKLRKILIKIGKDVILTKKE